MPIIWVANNRSDSLPSLYQTFRSAALLKSPQPTLVSWKSFKFELELNSPQFAMLGVSQKKINPYFRVFGQDKTCLWAQDMC